MMPAEFQVRPLGTPPSPDPLPDNFVVDETTGFAVIDETTGGYVYSES